MLKITSEETEAAIAIRLEGRIAGPWSEELTRFWEETVPRIASRSVVLDLRDVTYADRLGAMALRAIYAQSGASLLSHSPWSKHLAERIKSPEEERFEEVVDYRRRFRNLLNLPGKFFNKLSPEALNTLMWMACPMSCEAGTVLFPEGDSEMECVYLILDGEVGLSMTAPGHNSITYSVAKMGDILGLASVLSKSSPEMTAEALVASKLARIWRQDLFNFLSQNPEAYEAVIEEIREDLLGAMQFLRTMKLTESIAEPDGGVDRSSPATMKMPNGEGQHLVH